MHTHVRTLAMSAALLLCLLGSGAPASAQEHAGHARPDSQQQAVADTSQDPVADAQQHAMFMRSLGGGWRLLGMAQVFPIVTAGFGGDANEAVTRTELYATQPVAMFNVESPRARVVLRTTLNFEGVTQSDGELTFGGWGEGFIDKRHPHTLLHEAMLSLNFWNVGAAALSISAGKGFAPYGTDDPMSRPVAKYPTNHHLSQLLERFTLNGTVRGGGWSLEAGVFGGTEPTGPYDFSNIESFPNSWSARATRRFGGTGTAAPWEVSASFGHVVEEHDDEERATSLLNAYVRHERAYGFGRVYALLEASRSDPEEEEDGYWAVLAEAQLTRGRHQPYARFEAATRPEFAREGPPGTEGFYRYDHDDHPIGATRWTILSAGYGYHLTSLPFSARTFLEAQYHTAAPERGPVTPRELFGEDNFWSVSAGVRLFFGGGPMRMGSYGVLDAMTDMMRTPAMAGGPMEHHR